MNGILPNYWAFLFHLLDLREEQYSKFCGKNLLKTRNNIKKDKKMDLRLK
jgi:hypothetical protein